MAVDYVDAYASKDYGIVGLDVDEFTVACRVYVDSASLEGVFYMTASSISAGNSRFQIAANPPGTSGWRLIAGYRFDSIIGKWEYQTDLNLGQWYDILVHYDRSSTANDPDIYIDGSLVTVVEVGTPSGSATTGVDSIIFGKHVGLGAAFDGRLAESTFWTGDKTALALQLNQGASPELFPQDLKCYWDMIRTGREKMQGADLTLTSTAAIAHPPIIYPAQVFSGLGTAAVAAGRITKLAGEYRGFVGSGGGMVG